MSAAKPVNALAMIPLDLIDPHPSNPRDTLAGIDELAESIRAAGLLQPITVHRSGARFTVRIGHRRLAACRKIGMPEILSVITTEHGDRFLLDALAENEQRVPLNPLDIAVALRGLVRDHGTQQRVSALLGKNGAWVSMHLALLDAPEWMRRQIRTGAMAYTAAYNWLRADKAQRAGRAIPLHRGHHFTRSHPLAGRVAAVCDHDDRRHLGGVGCGQCWEQAIRSDALGAHQASPPPAQERSWSRRQDVDEVKVLRAVGGERTDLTVPERREVVRRLHAHRLSDAQIGDRMHMSARNVLRIRGELDLPPNFDSGREVTA